MALFGALCVGWYHAGMQNKSDFFRLSKKQWYSVIISQSMASFDSRQ